MNSALPIDAASVATALILFAIYLRVRGRASWIQTGLLILFAVLVFLGISALRSGPAGVDKQSGGIARWNPTP